MSTNPHQLRFQNNVHSLEQTQRAILDGIVRSNSQSAYTSRLALGEFDSAESYVKKLPLVSYESIRPWVDQIERGESNVLTQERTLAFFKTSGSLAKPKLIPVTPTLMRQKVAAFATFWGLIYASYPDIATGTIVSNFTDAGETERTIRGVEVCSESSFWGKRGRSLHSLKRWPLPAELRLVNNTQARHYAVARLLLQTDLHCIMCLNPSTLLQFCRVLVSYKSELYEGLQKGTWGTHNPELIESLSVVGKAHLHSYLRADSGAAQRLSPGNQHGIGQLSTLWPSLQLIVCWRSRIVQPYFSQLEEFIGELPVRDYITQSSECMMAIPIEDGGSGGVLAYTMHFFEFIPEADVDASQPATLFAWQVHKGGRYELVVTTGGGLYRYRTGDCIQITGFFGDVPTLEFLYRFGKTSSITGEKLTEYQVLMAAAVAHSNTGFQPGEFLCFPCSGSMPCYGVLLDPGAIGAIGATDAQEAATVSHTDLLNWVGCLDTELQSINSEYQDKRASQRLGPMIAFVVACGDLAQERLRRKAKGVSDEQVKSEVLTSRLDMHTHIDSARGLE